MLHHSNLLMVLLWDSLHELGMVTGKKTLIWHGRLIFCNGHRTITDSRFSCRATPTRGTVPNNSECREVGHAPLSSRWAMKKSGAQLARTGWLWAGRTMDPFCCWEQDTSIYDSFHQACYCFFCSEISMWNVQKVQYGAQGQDCPEDQFHTN